MTTLGEARLTCGCVNCKDVTLWPCARRDKIVALLDERDSLRAALGAAEQQRQSALAMYEMEAQRLGAAQEALKEVERCSSLSGYTVPSLHLAIITIRDVARAALSASPPSTSA